MYHPDKNKGKEDKEMEEANKKFKLLAEAYSILNDEKKKSLYLYIKKIRLRP